MTGQTTIDCPACGAPPGAICKKPDCVRLPQTTALHPATLAAAIARKKIDRLNHRLATKDFGPDRATHTAPIYAEIARLRAALVAGKEAQNGD